MIERFVYPAALAALAIPPLLLAWRWWRRDRHELVFTVSAATLHRLQAGRGRVALRYLPPALRLVALVLLAIALARPQGGTRTREVTSEGVDIILTLDSSTSMKGEDFRPRNRLEEAKAQAAEFVSRRPNDRIGLVAFAGQAYTACPLTLDHDLLTQFVGQVKMGLVVDGTAIGSALATATNRLRESQAKSKVIVLLTDGDNNAGSVDPLTAARAAAAMHIKVYTIGVGKDGQVPYPVDDMLFGKRYQYVMSNLDETVLRKIAELTGGRYFRATSNEALARIYAEIDKLERSEVQSIERVDYHEAGLPFLLPAAGLLLLEFLLGRLWLRRAP